MKKIFVKYTFLLFAVIALLGLSSCEKKERPDKLEVVSVERVSSSPDKGSWIVTMTVNNNTLHNVRFKSAIIYLLQNGKKICRLALANEIELPRRSTTQVDVPVRVTLANPLAAVSAVNKVIKGNYEGLTIDYNATLSTRTIKKLDVSDKGVELKELVGSFNSEFKK